MHGYTVWPEIHHATRMSCTYACNSVMNEVLLDISNGSVQLRCCVVSNKSIESVPWRPRVQACRRSAGRRAPERGTRILAKPGSRPPREAPRGRSLPQKDPARSSPRPASSSWDPPPYWGLRGKPPGKQYTASGRGLYECKSPKSSLEVPKLTYLCKSCCPAKLRFEI